MCVGEHGPLGIYVRGNAILGETHIIVTPALALGRVGSLPRGPTAPKRGPFKL